MSVFPRAVTAPSTLQHWYPQPQSQMPCSQTACPTRSTWLSSKPRFPVPKTFTLPCWTVPTRSLARLLHLQLALGAASEVLVVGERQRMKYSLRQSRWFLLLIYSWCHSNVAETSRGQQKLGGSTGLHPCLCCLHPLCSLTWSGPLFWGLHLPPGPGHSTDWPFRPSSVCPNVWTPF